jgi:hypothetical protein
VPDQLDRCWLDPADKQRVRVVDGQIGLAAAADAVSA